MPICSYCQSARFFIYLSPLIFYALGFAYFVVMVRVVVVVCANLHCCTHYYRIVISHELPAAI